jgi:hypothetical protein
MYDERKPIKKNWKIKIKQGVNMIELRKTVKHELCFKYMVLIVKKSESIAASWTWCTGTSQDQEYGRTPM